MSGNEAVIKAMIDKARVAQREFEQWTQQQIDEVVMAVAWAGYKKENAEHLARIAVEETTMGNVGDKITKIRNKTKGTLRDLTGARSVGIIEVNEKTGATKIAKPKGVVGALIPATNPEATPIHRGRTKLVSEFGKSSRKGVIVFKGKQFKVVEAIGSR